MKESNICIIGHCDLFTRTKVFYLKIGKKDQFYSAHHIIFQSLAIEVVKARNTLTREIMNEIFSLDNQITNFGHKQIFSL